MTKLNCPACDEYDPPNCKCMCHEIIKYYERVQLKNDVLRYYEESK